MFHRFSTNHFVANAGKCHLLTRSKTPVDMHISNTEILNEEKVKLRGVNIECRLKFDFHVNKKKESKKYHAVTIVWNCMNKKKRRILMNAFITSQFSYCPLVWMPHNRTVNYRINKIYEKALRLVYKYENKSLF